ncbi:MAG TPA: GNAT family N-acetyltransferase [Chloroflexota bacterium]|nr:GNAT family N-acetyltransferase [Chloroflexota bacterium]
MALEMRPPAEDELERVLTTVEAVFGKELRQAEESLAAARATLPLDRILSVFDGSSVVGVAAAYPFSMIIPGGELPCSGVSWVGVLPSHRRRGLARDLMRRQLSELHERGEPLAALWASEAAIYGRFGYGYAVPGQRLDADRAGFAYRSDAGPVGQVRLLALDQALETLPGIYDRARPARVGVLARTLTWWREHVLSQRDEPPDSGTRFLAALELDGLPEAYAIYRVRRSWEQGLPGNTVAVQEALGTSALACKEMWRFLFSIDLSTRVTARHLDPAAPLRLGVVDPRRLRISLGDGLRLRLVDVGAALAARSWATADALIVEVHDDFCPWNNGTYRLGQDAGRASGAPALSLDVMDLASAYLGGVSISWLAAAGLVEEHTPGAVARADALLHTALPPHSPGEF